MAMYDNEEIDYDEIAAEGASIEAEYLEEYEAQQREYAEHASDADRYRLAATVGQ